MKDVSIVQVDQDSDACLKEKRILLHHEIVSVIVHGCVELP